MFFYDLTKNLFKYRRKKIENSLRKQYKFNLKNIPFKNNRIDDLSPEQIAKLSNILINQID